MEAKPARVERGTPLALGELWSRARGSRELTPRVRRLMQALEPVSLEAGRLRARSAGTLSDVLRGGVGELEGLLGSVAGERVALEVIEEEAPAPAAPEGQELPGAGEGGEDRPEAAAELHQHPLVAQALEVFGGSVVRVEPRREGGR